MLGTAIADLEGESGKYHVTTILLYQGEIEVGARVLGQEDHPGLVLLRLSIIEKAQVLE